MLTGKLMYPFGAADHLTPDHAVTHDITIENQMTIFEPGVLTANSTLNIEVDPEVRDGARLLCKIKATATETLTFGTAIDAPVLVGVAGKTKCIEFVLVAGVFVASGAFVQID